MKEVRQESQTENGDEEEGEGLEKCHPADEKAGHIKNEITSYVTCGKACIEMWVTLNIRVS